MGQTKREARIDFLRGITLLLIFIGHAEFTFSLTFQHSRGFADASEIFVLLAGISSALAYHRPGAPFSVSRPWARAWRIYLVHMALVAVMTALGALVIAEFPHTTVAQDMAGMIAEPVTHGLEAMLLFYMPGNLDILPIYIVFLLFVPFGLVIYDRFPRPVLAASFILWLVSGALHLNFYNLALDTGRWYLDPLSWQFIFIIGIALGMRIRRGVDPLPYHRRLFILAAVVALVAIPANLAVHLGWVSLPYPDLYRELVTKTNSGPLRILDALAILYLAFNIDWIRRAANSSWLQPINVIGRHSLPVFSVGIILSALASVYVDMHPGIGLATQMLILIAGCAAHLLLGWLLERCRQHAAKAARQAADYSRPA